ncbi:MAG: hypothetical protein U9R15_15185 [Chloroflexota bacterium]|nr:hypothetical protein [Chloroflexota bacterium]
MKLQDIILDLHALEERIRAYERKYGITSHDFYELYHAGVLDDEGFEKTREFTRWASAYEMKLEREATFEQLSEERVSRMRRQLPDRPIQLVPQFG